MVFGALTGRDDGLMLQQKNGVLAGAVGHLIMDAVLVLEALDIVHIVRGEAHSFNSHRHTSTLDLWMS